MTSTRGSDQLLLGEWACLGILLPAPTHGFAVAARLKPSGDIGRVWALSRALTYRALEQLVKRGYVVPVGEEPGRAGGNRTILATTQAGRTQLVHWLTTPVIHLRDMRSELLLKLVLCDVCHVDNRTLLREQHRHVSALVAAIDEQISTQPDDVVVRWRSEASHAALRFVSHLLDAAPTA